MLVYYLGGESMGRFGGYYKGEKKKAKKIGKNLTFGGPSFEFRLPEIVSRRKKSG